MESTVCSGCCTSWWIILNSNLIKEALHYVASIRVLPQFVQLHPSCTKIFLKLLSNRIHFSFPLIIASKMTLFLFVSIRILTGKSSPLNLRVLIRMTIRSIANVTQRHTSCVDAPLSQENYIINMTYRFLQIYFVSETPSSVYPRIIGTNFNGRHIKIYIICLFF